MPVVFFHISSLCYNVPKLQPYPATFFLRAFSPTVNTIRYQLGKKKCLSTFRLLLYHSMSLFSSDILKKFNQFLKGFSRDKFPKQNGFNMAVAGAKASYVQYFQSLQLSKSCRFSNTSTCICTITARSHNRPKISSRQ